MLLPGAEGIAIAIGTYHDDDDKTKLPKHWRPILNIDDNMCNINTEAVQMLRETNFVFEGNTIEDYQSFENRVIK